MHVNREKLLNCLEAVQPGLSTREIVEQSSCFIFEDGRVMSYNDEIACSIETGIKLEGAIQAVPLMGILRKLQEETLKLTAGKDQLLIEGKRKKAGIRMEVEILLPIDKVERPKKWRKLPDDFCDAIKIVEQCAGTDESNFFLTCVHIHPKFVEACDNHQVSRYKVKTGVKKETLVRRDSIKHVVSFDMTEFSETESWMHFRNPAGLVLSCRRYAEEYSDVSKFLKVKGEPITLPKGLADAADKAEVFSSENTEVEDNQVLVDLRPGKLRITGRGVSGWYTENRKLKYNGPALSFQIAPKLLIELTQRHNECEISSTALKVDGGKFVYVTCLGEVVDK